MLHAHLINKVCLLLFLYAVQLAKSQQDKEKHSKKESSTSPSQKLSQRSQSPPSLSESPLSPGHTQKGAKSTKSQKHSSPKPTPTTKGLKNSPKSKNRENKDVVKKEKLPSLSEYLQPGYSSETALKVLPQTTVKLESTLSSQSVPISRLDSKDLTAPLSKSNKKPKPSLGNSQPTMFSVVGPPLKVPLVEIKSLPRDSLSLPAQIKRQTNVKTSSLNKEGGLTGDLFSEEVESYNILSHPSVCRRVLLEESDNDVVHCVCGDLTDEGFMIQVSWSMIGSVLTVGYDGVSYLQYKFHPRVQSTCNSFGVGHFPTIDYQNGCIYLFSQFQFCTAPPNA